jgi:mannose-6-phosphate isomerase-like protein (cupin superfamily)
MRAFEADQVVARSLEHGELYLEIVRGTTASVGLYTLPVGAHDPQGVHDEDEVYHVLEGRARLRVADDDRPVGPGSIVYIDAGVPHSLPRIEELLRVLVSSPR